LTYIFIYKLFLVASDASTIPLGSPLLTRAQLFHEVFEQDESDEEDEEDDPPRGEVDKQPKVG
jgi:hypothetical protein